MKATILSIIIAIFMIGCNGQLDTHRDEFQILGGFTQGQLQVIDSATQEICEATNGHACASYFQSDAVESNFFSSIEGVEVVDATNLSVTGQYFYEGTLGNGLGQVVIRNTLNDTKLRLTTIHELGHHFGCEHLHDGSIMEAYSNNITSTTITQSMIDCMSR